MTVICAASESRPPQHASRPPGSLHLLRRPLPNRPSTRRSVQSSGFARFRMAARVFKILFAASLTQNPLATRFFFMAGAMATWQQNRLATDERWGPQEADSVANQTRTSRPPPG